MASGGLRWGGGGPRGQLDGVETGCQPDGVEAGGKPDEVDAGLRRPLPNYGLT